MESDRLSVPGVLVGDPQGGPVVVVIAVTFYSKKDPDC